MSRREPALLVLEDGTAMKGAAYGALGSTFGEAVFSTGMTGYQETLTDPSYHRQVVVMTSPHIGNTGVNEQDPESGRIWVSGYVVRDPSRTASNWRATGGLEDELRAQGVVGICDTDTRALTRRLRERGAMRMGIFSGDHASASVAEHLSRVLGRPPMAGADLTAEVSTGAPYVVPAVGIRRLSVVAIDLGITARSEVGSGLFPHGFEDAVNRGLGVGHTQAPSPSRQTKGIRKELDRFIAGGKARRPGRWLCSGRRYHRFFIEKAAAKK